MCDVFRKHEVIDTLPQRLHRRSAEVLEKSVRPDLDKSLLTLDNMASNRRMTRLTSEGYTGMTEKSGGSNVDRSSSDNMADNTEIGVRARLSSELLAKSVRPNLDKSFSTLDNMASNRRMTRLTSEGYTGMSEKSGGSNVDRSSSDNMADNTEIGVRARLSSVPLPINNVTANAGNSSQETEIRRQYRAGLRESSPRSRVTARRLQQNKCSPPSVVPGNTRGISAYDQNVITITKSYWLLKEEMQKREAIYLGRALFSDWDKAVKLAVTRRNHVDILLKKVLKDSQATQECFITKMKTTIENIELKKIKDTDIKAYRSLHETDPQFRYGLFKDQCLFFSKNDRDTLHVFLEKESYIEQVNDKLLSGFIFTLNQHSQVKSCAGKKEKVRLVLNLMETLKKQTFESFAAILESIGLGHVLPTLEQHKEKQKRKHTELSDTKSESEISRPQKKPCLTRDLQAKVVAVSNKPKSHIKETLSHYGFDVEHVKNGSIVIQFRARGPSAWKELKQFCRDEDISKIVTKIFDDEALYDILPTGDFNVQVDIYVLSGEDKGMIVLNNADDVTEKKKTSTTSDKKPAVPVDVYNLLLEELDVDADLLAHLESRKIVNKIIIEGASRQKSRKDKVAHVMEAVSQDESGYSILRDYIKGSDRNIYEQLLGAEAFSDVKNSIKRLPTGSEESLTKDRHRKKKFFTCNLILSIHKSEKTAGTPISCSKASDCVCYFDKEDDASLFENNPISMNRELSFDTAALLTEGSEDEGFSKRSLSPEVLSAEENTKQKKLLRSAAETEYTKHNKQLRSTAETEYTKINKQLRSAAEDDTEIPISPKTRRTRSRSSFKKQTE